jgi:N-acetylglucosamine kinase-like BadF-type ATPase
MNAGPADSPPAPGEWSASNGDGELAAVVVGIDAGGTATRARAVRAGRLVHAGTGGPGNPLSADAQTILASYRAALAGCPPATQVAACVAGTRSPAQHAQITELLAGFFPGAAIQVVPDYVGALLAAPDQTDACVVAGTGSVICSQGADGGYPASGGRGWILGDHGSAARLGRTALEHYVDDPAAVPAGFAAALGQAIGHRDPSRIVAAVNSAPDPARLLARAAPLLTGAAEAGSDWAVRHLDTEMAMLAATTARHIGQHVSGQPGTAPGSPVRIALAGGVWASPAARSSFTVALDRGSPQPVIVTRSAADPVTGAVRLAESLARLARDPRSAS